MQSHKEYEVNLEEQFSDDAKFLAFWYSQKCRVTRAEIPPEYHPASQTKQFWRYPFGLVIEILPSGFQFTHVWKAGDDDRSAKQMLKVFGGQFLDGSKGIPGSIRSLSGGRKLITWKSKSLERLEGLLGTYGQDYNHMLCSWLADWDAEFDAEAKALDAAYLASLKQTPKQ